MELEEHKVGEHTQVVREGSKVGEHTQQDRTMSISISITNQVKGNTIAMIRDF